MDAASPVVDGFTESTAWTAETDISPNEVVEKENLIRYVANTPTLVTTASSADASSCLAQ